ncbi:MAG: hypothetical protein NC082_03030 [Clostridiales bacterium]|nr:hypothetical protein [Clostridiales bacterium]
MKILYCEQEIPLNGMDSEGSTGSRVTLLTDSSMSRNHRPLFIPPHHEKWTMTLAPAFRISRLGKCIAPRFAHRYYDAVSLIARLRPADIPSTGLLSSAIDSAFDSATVVGEWIRLPGRTNDHLPHPENDITATLMELKLQLSGNVNISVTIDMSQLDSTIAWLSSYFMVKHGDIIVPGDFSSIPVEMDTTVEINVNTLPCLDFKFK